jgi:hypothetical protein
LTLRR